MDRKSTCPLASDERWLKSQSLAIDNFRDSFSTLTLPAVHSTHEVRTAKLYRIRLTIFGHLWLGDINMGKCVAYRSRVKHYNYPAKDVYCTNETLLIYFAVQRSLCIYTKGIIPRWILKLTMIWQENKICEQVTIWFYSFIPTDELLSVLC